MEAYPWSGNVRELKNAIERMLVATPSHIIDAKAFESGSYASTSQSVKHAPPKTSSSYQEAMSAYERDYITGVMEACDGDVRTAAKQMKLHISTLYRKLEQYKS